MARVNIEECWWSDPRRSKLIRLIGGDSRLADGLAMAAWRLAQEFWKHERTLIPLTHFENLEDSEFLIQSKLAEVRDGQVYVRGSSQYLDWTYEKQEAGKKGGQESAKRARNEKGHFLPPSKVQAEPKQSPSTIQAEPSGAKPLTLIPVQEESIHKPENQQKEGVNELAHVALKLKTGKGNPGIRTEYPDIYSQLWEQFERRGEKKAAFEIYKSLKLSGEEVDELKKCISLLKTLPDEWKYRKYFERFLKTDWREILNRPKSHTTFNPFSMETL